VAEIKVERKQRSALPWILGLLVLALLLWALSRMIGGRNEVTPADRPAPEVGSAAPAPLAPLAPMSPVTPVSPGSAALFAPLAPRILPAVNPYAACADAGMQEGEPACTGLAARHRLWA
jgi:hypothetical protein